MRVDIVITALVIVLLYPLSANAQESVDCFHDEAGNNVSPAENCALVSDSELVRFAPELLTGTHYDEDGLSCVVLAQGLGAYLVRENGRFARVPFWDNTCAWFIEGLSVTQLDRRQAYIDKDLDMVLDPGFELLGAFSQEGYAKVCNGPFVFEDRGERVRTGGKCGLINRSGELVVELNYPYEDSVTIRRDFQNSQNEQNASRLPTN